MKPLAPKIRRNIAFDDDRWQRIIRAAAKRRISAGQWVREACDRALKK